MATYLVTGAAGFIGARVSEFLLEDGHTVIGVDNLCDAYDVRLKLWRLERLQRNANFVFHHKDLCDLQALEAIFASLSSLEAIIHLAARAGVRYSVEDPWTFVNANVTGTLNTLEMAKRHKVPKYILASTSSIYGANAPIPTPEEADSSRPLQPYAATKKAAEALCHSYHFLYDIDVTLSLIHI